MDGHSDEGPASADQNGPPSENVEEDSDVITLEENVTQITAVAPVKSPAKGTEQAFLVFIYPAAAQMGQRFELTQNETVIGRGSDADIVIDRDSVSRKHAKVTKRRGGFWVADLGSTNGTYVNDEVVDEHPLRDGDFLQVGNAIYKFLSGGNVEAAYYEEIYRLTIVDGLTRAYNKRYFDEFLERELARCARTGRPLALVMFDIDHFKKINDTYGHLTGDFILKELCGRISRTVRKDELLARYGGEEFCVVLPEASRQGAMEFAERIRRLVEAKPFLFEGRKIKVTISLGVAVTIGDDMGPSTFVQMADDHLYEAKRSGRNRVAG